MDYQILGAYIDKAITLLVGLAAIVFAKRWAKTEKHQKILRWLGALLVLIGVAQFFLGSPIQKAGEAIVERLNAGAPLMVDEMTRLDRVELEGEKRLVYYYTLIGLDEESKAQMQSEDGGEEFSRAIKETVGGNPMTSKLTKSGFSLVFQYRDEEGRTLATVEM